MGILIKTIRIAGLRGLENLKMDLEKTTILTGINNSGKSSVLYALKLALGRQSVIQEDFFIKENLPPHERIIIDILIRPVSESGDEIEDFPEDWEMLFTTDKIKQDISGKSFVPFRTTFKFDPKINGFKKHQFSMKSWPDFNTQGKHWFEDDDGKESSFYFDEIPFFYMDAQRDLLQDIKSKSSFLGKILSKIEYAKDDIEKIEEQIRKINEMAVNNSESLSQIKAALQELNSTIGNENQNIEVTPFTKKVRDLNKGLSIYYSEGENSFSMEYHGMGTRSWSSLLTLKAFITLLNNSSHKKSTVFFPILAIEEPEAHLHPNAQKQLYQQIDSIPGQKIIATHSHFIASAAEHHQIRGLYKGSNVVCGKIDLPPKDLSRVKREIIHSRGEILFSKFLLLVEGETEKYALPVFAKEYFGEYLYEMGVDIVSCNTYTNYPPFINFAKSLHIPWMILSDAEEDTINRVRKDIAKFVEEPEDKYVFFLDEGKDFESQLECDGFKKQIDDACSFLKRNEIRINNKVEKGFAIANEITKKGDIPPKIKELFDRIQKRLEERK